MIRITVGLIVMAVAAAGCAGEESAPKLSSAVAFQDIAEEAGLASFRNVTGAKGDQWFPETMGSGGAFFDLDGDTHPDIALIAGGSWEAEVRDTLQAIWVYRNRGDGTFERVHDPALARLKGYGFGVIAADYDADGDEDLFFTSLGPNALLRNDEGQFTNVTTTVGIDPGNDWSTAAAFMDADRDGHMDLYVGSYVAWTPETDIYCSQDGENKGYCTPELYKGVGGRYYHNRGDGTFDDQTKAAGFGDARGKTLGSVVLDYDRDGWPDLALANDTEPDELYANNGDGTFREIGVVSGLAFDERGRARAGMGMAAGVIDETGEQTVIVGNFSGEMIGVYRHMGNGVFLDRAAASQVGRPSLSTLTFGVVLFDADLDGDLDLYAANGHVQPHIERVNDHIKFREPPHLFLNDGDGLFEDVAQRLGGVFSQPIVARGVASADVDGDGDVDLLITENGGPAHLWRNDTGGDYLRVRLPGSAIGASIRLDAGGRSQWRYVRSGGSYLSDSEHTVTFGLGAHPRVDSLVVQWPDGRITRQAGVAPNQTVTIAQ